MEETNKGRIEYIDVLRGFMILLMVMGHIGFSNYFDKYIHMFHMPVWFFISGFFYHDKKVSFVSFAGNKVRALIIPYLFWGLIQYPLWILLEMEEGANILEPLVNLLWVNTNLIMPIAGALWFLTSLFFAEIVFELLHRICKRFLGFCIVCVLIALLGNIWTTIIPIRLPWAIDTAFVGVGIMLLGHLFRRFQNNKWVSKISELPVRVLLILLVVNAFLCFLNGYINMRIGMYGFIPLFWFNMILAILIYWRLSYNIFRVKDGNKLTKKIVDCLEDIGRHSIVFLCLNQLAIACFQKILSQTGIFVYVPVACVLTLFFTMAVLFLFEKLAMNSKIRILFGIST